MFPLLELLISGLLYTFIERAPVRRACLYLRNGLGFEGLQPLTFELVFQQLLKLGLALRLAQDGLRDQLVLLVALNLRGGVRVFGWLLLFYIGQVFGEEGIVGVRRLGIPGLLLFCLRIRVRLLHGDLLVVQGGIVVAVGDLFAGVDIDGRAVVAAFFLFLGYNQKLLARVVLDF